MTTTQTQSAFDGPEDLTSVLDDASTAFDPAIEMTRLRGGLPPRPRCFVNTPVVTRVRLAVDTSVRTGWIATISGPVGVGKSTAVAEAGRLLNREVVYVLMADATSVKASLQVIWESMTRTPALGVEKQVKDSILRHLLRHDLTLLIDDAHYVSTRGLRVLTSIWNELDAQRGKGVSMVLVGNDLTNALKGVPEIQSRVCARFEVPPLGGDDLFDALAVIEPRTAATDRSVLVRLDRQHFRGEIRQWVQFLEVLRMQRGSDQTSDGFTDTEIRHALLRQGWL